MRIRLSAHLFFAVGLALWSVGCSPGNREKEAESSTAKAPQVESRVKHGTNGEITITLDAETQKIMGLQTAALEPASFRAEVKGFGRVLDALPLAVLASEIAAAQAAGDASEADLKRLKALTSQGNASERALQAAVAATARDRAQVNSARLRLAAGWGRVLAGRQDLPALAQSLVSQESALVQIDVPAGEWSGEMPTGARISLLREEAKPIDAGYVSPTPMVDPQTQGRGFLFLVATNPSGLVPGAAIMGFLKLPGEAVKGVTVPESAVIRHENKTWVYVQKDAANFIRQEIVLNQPSGSGWFVALVFHPNDRVVVAGAQTLLSEELKAQTRLPD